MKRLLLILYFLPSLAFAQTLGGASAYNFLKLSTSPLATASGGANISYRVGEVSTTATNPALLRPSLSTQINASFSSFLGGIKKHSLNGAYHVEDWQTTFGGHINYTDYGSIPATDAAGNVSGDFRPVDFVVQVSAARKYLERWTYGGTLKFINSSYQNFRSSALAVDIGLNYFDSASRFSASVVASNMGTQLKTYAGVGEDLPFDLQIGITKRLAKAPFGFSLTAQNVHRYNLNYNDTEFNSANGYSSPSAVQNLFNHFIAATHIYIGQHVEATIGYNHLRRQELSLPEGGSGLTGFSAGLRIIFQKLQILYGRSVYQRGVGLHQIGITTQLNRLFL